MSFGTTPPQFPIRGHFWWDGALLHMWDGVQWETIGPTAPSAGGGGITEAPVDGNLYGRQNAQWAKVPVLPTTTEVFAIGVSANIGRVADTGYNYTIFPFADAPTVNSGTWDAVNRKFTPAKPGYYVNFIRQYFQGPTGGPSESIRSLIKNDAGNANSGFVAANNGMYSAVYSAGYVSGSGVVQMNGTTDFLRLWVYDTNTTLFASSLLWQAFLLP